MAMYLHSISLARRGRHVRGVGDAERRWGRDGGSGLRYAASCNGCKGLSASCPSHERTKRATREVKAARSIPGPALEPVHLR